MVSSLMRREFNENIRDPKQLSVPLLDRRARHRTAELTWREWPNSRNAIDPEKLRAVATFRKNRNRDAGAWHTCSVDDTLVRLFWFECSTNRAAPARPRGLRGWARLSLRQSHAGAKAPSKSTTFPAATEKKNYHRLADPAGPQFFVHTLRQSWYPSVLFCRHACVIF